MTITNSQHSFIRFDEQAEPYCHYGDVIFCLPVYDENDIAFQFEISGTIEEIAELCNPYSSGAVISLVSDCDGEDILVFTEEPERLSISETSVVFNWQHGLPGFGNFFDYEQCFRIRVTIGAETFCSNCLQRIFDPCHTVVVEYGNEDDSFGFKYC